MKLLQNKRIYIFLILVIFLGLCSYLYYKDTRNEKMLPPDVKTILSFYNDHKAKKLTVSATLKACGFKELDKEYNDKILFANTAINIKNIDNINLDNIINEAEVDGLLEGTFFGGYEAALAIVGKKHLDKSKCLIMKKYAEKELYPEGFSSSPSYKKEETSLDETISTAQDKANKWILEEETSPINDKKDIYLFLESDRPIVSKRNKETTPKLAIRCKENETNLFIIFDIFLGSRDDIPVLHRLDKEEAKTARWSVSNDSEAIFKPNPIPFIKTMMQHEKLLVRVASYNGNNLMTEFNITGLSDFIAPLATACNWKKEEAKK